MAENSKIEWTDHTFNPWVGCTKVSPACDHCYAESWAKRSGMVQWGNNPRRRTSAANWLKPLKWNREAEAAGVRRKVFCASLADVFDNHGSITSGWHGDLWHLIHSTPNLDWLLLTKRPQNIKKMLPESYGMPAWGSGWPNVWLGVTAENQEEADRRIPILLNAPAAVRFVSVEPLLGPVDLTRVTHKDKQMFSWLAYDPTLDALTGNYPLLDGGERRPHPRRLNWVIAGGESGPGARPMHPGWARDIRDQCQAAGVAFHFKQWGEWSPCVGDFYPVPPYQLRWVRRDDGRCATGDEADRICAREGDQDWAHVAGVGKKRAGRLLDGREWNEFPEVNP